MNEQLAPIYKEYLSRLFNTLSIKEKEGVSKPLLLDVPVSYENEKVKVMIIGKETHGGWDFLKDLKIDDLETEIINLQLKYRNFIIDDAVSSPFWDFFQKLANRFELNWKRFIWNNISKIDVNKSTPPLYIQLKNQDGYLLVKKEIEILNPDLLIFTGSNEDWLKFIYQDLEFQEITPQLFEITHQNLPKNTYWTYHPNYLRRSGKYEIIDEIIDEIYNRYVKRTEV